MLAAVNRDADLRDSPFNSGPEILFDPAERATHRGEGERTLAQRVLSLAPRALTISRLSFRSVSSIHHVADLSALAARPPSLCPIKGLISVRADSLVKPSQDRVEHRVDR